MEAIEILQKSLISLKDQYVRASEELENLIHQVDIQNDYLRTVQERIEDLEKAILKLEGKDGSKNKKTK